MCYSFFSNFVPLLDTLALFFQIRDDYANLLSEEVSSFLLHYIKKPLILVNAREWRPYNNAKIDAVRCLLANRPCSYSQYWTRTNLQ